MKKLKIFKRIILFVFIIIVLSFILARYYFYEVPILMYHRISAPYFDMPLLCVSPQSFSRQMDFISRQRYQVISLEELVDRLINKKTLLRNMVVITFDDGTEDIYQNAFNTLKKYGFPATVFVITDFVDKAGFLSWEQLKEMQKQGIDIGSHTQTHAYLPHLDESQLWQEIYASKKEIEKKLDKEITLFSYHIGGYNAKVIDFVKRAGYKGACTTNRGSYHLRPDIFALRRIKMTEDSDKPWVMWIKLSGIYNLLRRN